MKYLIFSLILFTFSSLITSCGSSSETPDSRLASIPMQTFEHSGMSLSYPTDWEKEEGKLYFRKLKADGSVEASLQFIIQGILPEIEREEAKKNIRKAVEDLFNKNCYETSFKGYEAFKIDYYWNNSADKYVGVISILTDNYVYTLITMCVEPEYQEILDIVVQSFEPKF